MIDPRTQDDGNLLLQTLLTHRLSHSEDQTRIKCTGHCHRCRKTNCRYALSDTEIISAVQLLTQPVGAIRKHHRRYSKTLHRFGMPGVQPRHKIDLFLCRHQCNQFFRLFAEFRSIRAGPLSCQDSVFCVVDSCIHIDVPVSSSIIVF